MKDCANAGAAPRQPPQTHNGNTYTGCGLTRGKTLHRRGHPICGGDKKKITDYADWTEKTIREIRKIRNR